MRWTLALNLALLVLFPIAWVAPLLRAGLNLPLLGLDEISVISGLVALWDTDRLLALLVALFAVVAPVAKIALLAAVQAGRLGSRAFMDSVGVQVGPTFLRTISVYPRRVNSSVIGTDEG